MPDLLFIDILAGGQENKAAVDDAGKRKERESIVQQPAKGSSKKSSKVYVG
jgi:hypothetical protein